MDQEGKQADRRMQFLNHVRTALKISGITLSERHRTQGFTQSMISTVEKCSGGILGIMQAEISTVFDAMVARGDDLLQHFDSLQIDTRGWQPSSQKFLLHRC
jgi:hypothetical protein